MRIFSNRLSHFCILLILLFAAVYSSGSDGALRKRLQYVTFDQFNKMYPRDKTEETVIVDLDEASLQKIGQWPWSRDVMADLTRNLLDMGATVVAYDMVFAESDRTSPINIVPDLEGRISNDAINDIFLLADHDEIFAEAIGETDNVVTGFTRARPKDTRYAPALAQPLIISDADRMKFLDEVFAAPGIATNLQILTDNAAGNGSFMATPEIDGIIRQVPMLVRFPPKPESAGWDDLSEDIRTLSPHLYAILGAEALRVRKSSKAINQIVPRGDRGGTGLSSRLHPSRWSAL